MHITLRGSFLFVRMLELASLLFIIGSAGTIVTDVASSGKSIPDEVHSALIAACVVLICCLIGMAFFLSGDFKCFRTMAFADVMSLVPFIVIAVFFGKSMSHLSCAASKSTAGSVTTPIASSYKRSDSADPNSGGAVLSLADLVGATKSACIELNMIWGMSIVLSILFPTSAVLLSMMFVKDKRAAAAARRRGP